MEKSEDFRALAEWYWRMAEIGHSEDRARRERLAQYLERRAGELELAQSPVQPPVAHT